jgi:UDP-N-acetyl-D-mannosaminuronate dehydrogenase
MSFSTISVIGLGYIGCQPLRVRLPAEAGGRR